MTLKKRAEFLFVAQGMKSSGRFLSLQARENTVSENIRFGLTASKKVGNAVKRNRARRRLRAILQQILPKYGLKGMDYVAIARPQTIDANYKDLLDEVEFLVKRLSKRNFSKPKPD
ncbi:MAG: ribonuclease P protein component [Caulobacterales bacterium]|nr:ribonuclease P protein component [Caulobacterales bacterium]